MSEKYKNDGQKTTEEVDAIEATLPRVTLDSVSNNGVVGRAFVDTGIRSNDRVRYLYVLVDGCSVTEVQRYIQDLQSNKITRDTLGTLRPQGAHITDIMPSWATPRIATE